MNLSITMRAIGSEKLEQFVQHLNSTSAINHAEMTKESTSYENTLS